MFGAVGFLHERFLSSYKTQIFFIFVKVLSIPIKALSIHKLQFRAALLAKRLKDDILKSLTVIINHVYMWKSSTTVLQWLKSDDNLHIFTANCVDGNLELTTFDEWHHVVSGDHPADTGTNWTKGSPQG